MDPPGIAGSRAHDRCGKVRSLSFSLFYTAFANAHEVIIIIVIIMIMILIAAVYNRYGSGVLSSAATAMALSGRGGSRAHNSCSIVLASNVVALHGKLFRISVRVSPA